MQAIAITPTLIYVLLAVTAIWFWRRLVADAVARRGLSSRQARPFVLKALAGLAIGLGIANTVLEQPLSALLFGLVVAGVQAAALLFTLRLAEAQTASDFGGGSP